MVLHQTKRTTRQQSWPKAGEKGAVRRQETMMTLKTQPLLNELLRPIHVMRLNFTQFIGINGLYEALGYEERQFYFFIHLGQPVGVHNCLWQQYCRRPSSQVSLAKRFFSLSLHHFSIATAVILTRRFRNVHIFRSSSWKCLNIKCNCHKRKHHPKSQRGTKYPWLNAAVGNLLAITTATAVP